MESSAAYQTPIEIAKFMTSMIPEDAVTVLEPTPGDGNILRFLEKYDVTAPDDFFKLERQKFDCIIMNPPFSSKYTYGIPEDLDQTGMRMGYYILTECMKMSNHVIALMPWFTLTDSDVRLRFLKTYGLKSITALPRKTFQYTRIQTCIFELHWGWNKETLFRVYDLIRDTTFNCPGKKFLMAV
jgi:type I restriction-modification system DNA methylase subunit